MRSELYFSLQIYHRSQEPPFAGSNLRVSIKQFMETTDIIDSAEVPINKELSLLKYCLLRAIEDKRLEMIEHGLEHGLNDDNTVRLSQELDQLLNKLDNLV